MKIRVSWRTQLSQFIIFNRFHDSLPELASQIVPHCLRREKLQKMPTGCKLHLSFLCTSWSENLTDGSGLMLSSLETSENLISYPKECGLGWEMLWKFPFSRKLKNNLTFHFVLWVEQVQTANCRFWLAQRPFHVLCSRLCTNSNYQQHLETFFIKVGQLRRT